MEVTRTVSAGEAGWSLQQFLREAMRFSYRETLLLKKADAIRVDGSFAYSNLSLSPGQQVSVILTEYPASAVSLPALPVPEILYLDDAVLAAYKPHDLQVHPSRSRSAASDTLMTRVQEHVDPLARPIHRLDAETAGIVLFARFPHVQSVLQEDMQLGRFRKTYEALVCGKPEASEGLLCCPIARIAPDSFTRAVSPDGQPAETRYCCLSTLQYQGSPYSHLRLIPLTGRTHQLRVHMQHLGCPILGDPRYFSDASRSLAAAMGIPFLQLCAVDLTFTHPITGKVIALHRDADLLLRP